MSFLVGAKPQDTNRNGYPDRIETEIMLFAWPHPTPIRQKGEFHFRLFAQGEAFDAHARPLAEWRVSGDAVRAAEGFAMAGPAYRFHLSLLDRGAGGDMFPLTAADLRATFIPDDGGSPIENDGVRSIQIGRR